MNTSDVSVALVRELLSLNEVELGLYHDQMPSNLVALLEPALDARELVGLPL